MSRAKSAENKKPPPRSPRVAAGPEGPGFARSMGESLGRIGRCLLPLLVILSFGTGISWLLWRPLHAGGLSSAGEGSNVGSGGASSRGRLTERSLAQAIPQRSRPAWISKDDFDAAVRLMSVAQDRSVFEPNLSRILAQQLASSPWVECVRSVRLRYPAQADIDVEWRRPEARIDGLVPLVIDRRGVVLNMMTDNALISDVPKISGLAVHAESAGKQLADPEIHEALKLLACVRDALSTSAGHLKVALLQRSASRGWRIVTDHGPAINWGFFGEGRAQDEPDTDEKQEKLTQRLREFGDPGRLEYISVYTRQAPVKLRELTPIPPPARAFARTK